MPTHTSPSGPAEELIALLHSVTACLETPEENSLVVCQKHLLRVIDILQAAKQTGVPIPSATRTTVQHINALRRQAETLLTQCPSGTRSGPLAYRRDGSTELVSNESGDFKMEV